MRLPPLVDGRLLRRYKRFLADIELPDGRVVTAHCPNTGAMTSCWRPGAPAQISFSDKPGRRLSWTLERVDMGAGWIGVHTGRVNAVIREAIVQDRLGPLCGYPLIRNEPRFVLPRHPPARFDLLLSGGESPDVYVEIKNTTLLNGDAVRFPDAVTERGRKHLRLLAAAVRRGFRGVIVFAINRPEGRRFEAAADVDPAYSDTLARVVREGVEVMAVRLRHTDHGIEVRGFATPGD